MWLLNKISCEIQILNEKVGKLMIENSKLEEENKKLKEEKEIRALNDRDNLIQIEKLEKENKNLKEKVRFLEECLDRKEKVNKSLREELDNRKSTFVYDAKKVRDVL